MSGQAAMMSAKEAKMVQKSIESGKPLQMCGGDVSCSHLDNKSSGGPKKKPISHK
jgi:hypothetical protein